MRGLTLGKLPAIVFPTAVAAYRKARPVERHPLLMNPGELLCLREALGLSVRDLARAVGRSERSVSRWERGGPSISRATADALNALVAYTDAAVATMVATHAAGDTIIVYLSDKEFRDHVDTGGLVLPASWHRAVAWRAKEQIPGATISWSS